MHQPLLRPVAVALAGLGFLCGAHAATYTVPAGVTKLQVTLMGAGGGAGGADLNGAAGKGASGAAMVVEFDVQPGQTVTYETGVGGGSGESWYKQAAVPGMKGGAGGAGQGSGGNGGDAPLSNYTNPSNPDPDSGSGGGGAGGGATSVTVNGQWARAGGGGGGGGGSWMQTTGVDAVAGTAAPVETATCDSAGAGAVGEFGTGTRAGHTNTGGGGGGGGGGGYVAQGGTGGMAGFDGSSSATGGGPGGSCYSAGVRMLSNSPAGGSPGTTAGVPTTSSGDASSLPPTAGPGTNGSASFVPVVEPVTPTATPGDSQAIVNVTPPPSIKPSDVVSYVFTCNPAMPITNPVPVASLPLTVTGLTNGTTYSCTVVANLIDPNTQTPYTTPVGPAATVTPSAAVVPPVAAPTPVPGLGGAGLALLSGLVAALGLRRKRRTAA